MTEARNILLIGHSWSGKSALGNLLINKNGNFKEVFKENGRTKEMKIEQVEEEGANYRIIDTAGWQWDANESKQQILTKIAESLHTPEGKIDRILLVTKTSNLWRYVIAAFDLLKKVDPELLNYITIVRSDFAEFENDEKREKFINDSKDPQIVGSEISEIVSQLPFIPIDNPWINTSISKIKGETEEFEARRKKKKLSRQIVFDHLKKICQESYRVDLENIAKFLSANSESSEEKTEKTTATETRNILLIGGTKNGKSALANTLVNEDGNFADWWH